MQWIEAFVRNPVKIAVGVLIVALFGFIGLLRMPMQLTPEVEIPKISIETTWPGASPHEIEREIIQEQEEQLQSVEGVTKMSSECSNSVGTITLEFKVGSDLSEGLLKVNSRLQQVPEYPEEADEPVISTSDPRANAIAWFILRPRMASPEEIEAFLVDNPDLTELLRPVMAAHNAGLRNRRMLSLIERHPEIAGRVKDLLPPDIVAAELRRFAEDFIEARFERVPGVSNSNVHGGREEELQVVVDPQRLAASGVTIVSGLARGIDGIAHQAALDAGGRTLAVLGSGLDHIYPPEHRNLARTIASSGAVLSDYPLGTSPEGGNFPARNRIIAGLSLAVIVVEAGESSGALITADFAAEQGRDVFAVPGRIYDRGSRGTNRLIASGAFPVTTVDDVLEQLNLESVTAAAPREPALPKDATERRVLEALSGDPVHIDELRERIELPIAELTACLSMLELRGQARQVGGMHYVRAHEPRAAYRVG